MNSHQQLESKLDLTKVIPQFKKVWNISLTELVAKTIAGDQHAKSLLETRLGFRNTFFENEMQEIGNAYIAEINANTLTPDEQILLEDLHQKTKAPDVKLTFEESRLHTDLQAKANASKALVTKRAIVCMFSQHGFQIKDLTINLNSDPDLENNSIVSFYRIDNVTKGKDYKSAAARGDLDAQAHLDFNEGYDVADNKFDEYINKLESLNTSFALNLAIILCQHAREKFARDNNEVMAKPSKEKLLQLHLKAASLGEISAFSYLAQYHETNKKIQLFCYHLLVDIGCWHANNYLATYYGNNYGKTTALNSLRAIYHIIQSRNTGGLASYIIEDKTDTSTYLLAMAANPQFHLALEKFKVKFFEKSTININLVINILRGLENDEINFKKIFQAFDAACQKKVTVENEHQLVQLRHDLKKLKLPIAIQDKIFSYLCNSTMTVSHEKAESIYQKARHYGLFKKLEDKYWEERHHNPAIARDYDKMNGLIKMGSGLTI